MKKIKLWILNIVTVSQLQVQQLLAPARVYMSQFKNNPNYNLLYTDTDSIFVEETLENSLVGSNLGQFKLENTYKEIVFFGPKIYSGVTENGQLVTKIKGFKGSKELSFEEMKTLLHKDNKLDLTHIKWFRSIDQIEMKEQPYLLSTTENKRQIIFDSNNVAIDTQAYKVNNNIKLK